MELETDVLKTDPKDIILQSRKDFKEKFSHKYLVLDDNVVEEKEFENIKLDYSQASDDEEIVIKFNKKELKQMIAEKLVERVIDKIHL
tara:strand:- start:1293 stop:1556 length:264 start_codon:yes stop_codon:yes gene_type:complete